MDASDTPNLLEMLLDYDTYLFHLKEDSRIPTDSLEYVEINLSCPSTQCPRIISFDTVIFARLLESIRNLELCNIQVGLKLAPFIDKVLLGQIAELISIYQSPARIAYIVCSNSIGVDSRGGDYIFVEPAIASAPWIQVSTRSVYGKIIRCS